MTLPLESTSTSGPVQVQSKNTFLTMFAGVEWKDLERGAEEQLRRRRLLLGDGRVEEIVVVVEMEG